MIKQHSFRFSYSFSPSLHFHELLRPLLTSRSTLLRRPFRHKARSPQVRTQSFTAQPPDLRCLNFDHKSFAVACLLTLFGFASYPVFVHRLTVSLHASSPHSVTLMQLRFASSAVVNLREDFHLQDCAHAGRTNKKSPDFTGLSGHYRMMSDYHLAERVGFEPTVHRGAQRFSRPSDSTTLAPLRVIL